MMKRSIWIGILAMALGACETSTPSAVDSGAIDGGGVDGGGESDGGTALDAPASVATHDCEEADFVDLTTGSEDSRMIMVPTGTTMFDFPCITIRAGQSVMFMWSFGPHPLAAGVAPGHPGTSAEPTPIEPQTSGALYTVAFPNAGDYAYHCATHFDAGMYGVVRVVP